MTANQNQAVLEELEIIVGIVGFVGFMLEFVGVYKYSA